MRRPFRPDTSAQGAVEFALVVPVLVLFVLAVISAGSLLFNYAAVANGARSGAREALVESTFLSATAQGALCESGLPLSIEAAVQHAATVVAVNPAPLCQSATAPTELVQAPAASASAANITLSCLPSLAPGRCQTVTVTVSLLVTPLFPLPGPLHLTASATESTAGA